MRRRCAFTSLILVICFLASNNAQAQSMATLGWYVATFGSDENDCRTPASSCASVRAVLDNPQFRFGSAINIERGRYYNPTETEESVLIDKNVILLGGWDSIFEQQTGYSFFDGEQQIGITVASGVKAEFYRIGSSGGDFDPRNENDYLLLDKGGLRNFGTLVYDNSGASGFYGYGIFNSGVLTMTQGSASANYGTGIENSGILTMIDSEVTDGFAYVGCGGISNSGTLMMEKSRILRNYARNGDGGICNFGEARITDSKIIDNISMDSVPYAGGGIVNYGGMWLTNSLVSKNYGYTGDLYNAGTVYLANSTINLPYASVSVTNTPEGMIYSRNSIVSGCNGTIQSDGYNLLADSEGCDWQAATGDILDRDPLLDAALVPRTNSPALNGGNPNGCLAWDDTPLDTDGHGNPRWQECDLGAYEYIPPAGEIFYQYLPLIQRIPES